jgi:hypothetical protein
MAVKPHHLAKPTMNRDDVIFWLSIAWFVALCGATIWALFWPVSVFGF